MAITFTTNTVTPTSGVELDVATITGAFDKISAFVQGGVSISGGLQYRLYAVVDGVRTLIAQSQVRGTLAASILEWQSVGCGTCAQQTQIVASGGESWVLTVATTLGGTLHAPITATLAGVSSSDTAADASIAASITAAPAQEVFLTTLGGYAENMDVAIDQTSLPSVFVTVYADCGAGSVRAMVKQTPLAGSDETISSVFRALELPVASNYYVSLANNSAHAVTKTLTACTYSGEAGGAGALNGDVIGPTNANTVVGWENVALDAVTMAAPTNAQIPVFDTAASKWRSISLSGGATIDASGVVTINSSVLTLAGDTVGPIGSNIVEGWRQIPLDPTSMAAPADAALPSYNIGTNSWHAVVMSGDATLTNGAVLTVAKVNGASVPAAGALTTGNVLQVTGISTLAYAPVNLGGGANYVTGTLPTGNQASQTMGGDVTGTTAASTVAKVNGATVPASGALTTGNVPQVTGISALGYGPVNLGGGVNFVTGTLPAGNQASQAMGGDVTGTTAASTVAKVNGATVPASGALTTGNVPQVTGISALGYGPVNLGGGANYVTGVLPTGNQAAQPLAGDVTGTTAGATVTAVNGTTVPAGGALTTGALLQVAGMASTQYTDVTQSPPTLPFANMQTHKITAFQGYNSGASVPTAIYGFNTFSSGGNGFASHPAPASTTRLTQAQRTLYQGTAAGQVGIREAGIASAWRGNSAGLGGFYFRSRFSLTLNAPSSTYHIFCGLLGAVSVATATNFSTDTTIAKLGLTATTNTTAGSAFPAQNWLMVEGSTAAITTHDLGAGFALTLSDYIEVIIYAAPNASSVSFVVNNLTTGATAPGTLNTTLPSNTTFLAPWLQNNIETSGAGTTQLAIANLYLETYE